MSDDLARQIIPGIGPDDVPQAVPYVQITETWARAEEAADALDRADSLGRVPVVVRIRQRAPLRLELFLIAAAFVLGAILIPAGTLLRLLLLVVGILAIVAAFASRMLIRVPAGSVGLVMRGGRQSAVLSEGFHRVNPFLVLTHVVTTRELAFDVPINEVRSADGIAVNVDLLLTIGIADPARMVYAVTPGDLDQLAQASTQDAVRTLIRSMEALDALDLGAAEADRLRETIDGRLRSYGVEVRAAAFTRVALPTALMASLEAKRLATVQLAEQHEVHALAQQRIADRASLVAQEAEARRVSVEHEAAAEAVRLAKLEERLLASANAARYDLEAERLRVAQQLAGNARAVVSFGGGDLVPELLLSREAAGTADVTPAAVPTPQGAAAPDPVPAAAAARRAPRARA